MINYESMLRDLVAAMAFVQMDDGVLMRDRVERAHDLGDEFCRIRGGFDEGYRGPQEELSQSLNQAIGGLAGGFGGATAAAGQFPYPQPGLVYPWPPGRTAYPRPSRADRLREAAQNAMNGPAYDDIAGRHLAAIRRLYMISTSVERERIQTQIQGLVRDAAKRAPRRERI